MIGEHTGSRLFHDTEDSTNHRRKDAAPTLTAKTGKVFTAE